MNKILPAALLALLLSVQITNAENLKVISITEELQALLKDNDTGEEWLALEGDEIGGWKVMSVEKDRVVIRKEVEAYFPSAIIKTIILPDKLRAMPVKTE